MNEWMNEWTNEWMNERKRQPVGEFSKERIIHKKNVVTTRSSSKITQNILVTKYIEMLNVQWRAWVAKWNRFFHWNWSADSKLKYLSKIFCRKLVCNTRINLLKIPQKIYSGSVATKSSSTVAVMPDPLWKSWFFLHEEEKTPNFVKTCIWTKDYI